MFNSDCTSNLVSKSVFWNVKQSELWHLTQMRCCFKSYRTAHSVLCGGRRQWIVLSAVVGDPPQSLHLPAEQSLKTGGELRTDREGLLSDILFVCTVSVFLKGLFFIAESSMTDKQHKAFHLVKCCTFLMHRILWEQNFWKVRLALSWSVTSGEKWNNVWKPAKVQNRVCFYKFHQQVELVFCEVGLCGSVSQTQEATE